MAETLTLRGTLEGHNGWVTQIATNPKFPDMILSSSRDKSLIVWKLTRDDQVRNNPHFGQKVVLERVMNGSQQQDIQRGDVCYV
jgi:hypothetical protein